MGILSARLRPGAALRSILIAVLACVPAAVSASGAAGADPACAGTWRLHDGRDLDLALTEDMHYRWRMKDGTSGKLSPEPGGGWRSTLGWTGRDDGHRVHLDGCAAGRIAFDGAEGRRLALHTVDTQFEVPGATLAGRLVLPPGDDPVPIVVLVHGAERSSARDHYALQRLFPSAGIGAFVYDKRGTGGSTGRYTQDFLVLANDAIAAKHEALRLAGARAATVGYQAGSQGGWVAPLAATIEPVDFVVVSFGLAVSPLDEDRAAIVLDMERHGYGPEVVEKAMEVADATAEILRSGFREGYERLDAVRGRYGAEPWFARVRGNISFFLLENDEATLRDVGPTLFPGAPVDYDPMPVLRNLRVPQLWILGGQDIDAPHEETARRLRALGAHGAPIRLTVFPEAEHGMYEFEVGADGKRLSTRQPEQYFPLMRDFILSAGKANAGKQP